LDALLGFGVTTAEVKSGYGLDVDTELKMLEAVRHLSRRHPIRLHPTYLGAHVVPKEYADKREQYVDLMISKMIPKVAAENLAKACDVFLDEGAYTFDEAEAIFNAANEVGLRPKVHAGQFTDQGGPELMARIGGLSADHLEQLSDAGIDAMAEAGVVANLLPGAAFSLRDSFPDGRRLIDRGVDVAVATDDNPGTSRTENLPLMAALAVTQMGLTCAEAWKSITINAAKALDLDGEIGALTPGRCADLTILDIEDFRTFLYHFGVNHTKMVITGGKIALGEQWI
jgi:imidazolonepropionase